MRAMVGITAGLSSRGNMAVRTIVAPGAFSRQASTEVGVAIGTHPRLVRRNWRRCVVEKTVRPGDEGDDLWTKVRRSAPRLLAIARRRFSALIATLELSVW